MALNYLILDLDPMTLTNPVDSEVTEIAVGGLTLVPATTGYTNLLTEPSPVVGGAGWSSFDATRYVAEMGVSPYAADTTRSGLKLTRQATSLTAVLGAALIRNHDGGRVPVSASTVYTFLASVSAPSSGHRMRISARWYDAGGVLLSTTVGANIGFAYQHRTGGYVVTSPSTAASVEMLVEVELNTGTAVGGEVTYVFNAMILRAGSTAAPASPGYFDGYTPGCKWLGTPGASQSVSTAYMRRTGSQRYLEVGPGGLVSTTTVTGTNDRTLVLCAEAPAGFRAPWGASSTNATNMNMSWADVAFRGHFRIKDGTTQAATAVRYYGQTGTTVPSEPTYTTTAVDTVQAFAARWYPGNSVALYLNQTLLGSTALPGTSVGHVRVPGGRIYRYEISEYGVVDSAVLAENQALIDGVAAMKAQPYKPVARWSAPAFTGGSAVTGYIVRALDTDGTVHENRVDATATSLQLAVAEGRPVQVFALNDQGMSTPVQVN